MKATPGRIVVELDDHASAMLRAYLRDGTGVGIRAGHDARDVVNACLVFTLEDPDLTSDWTTSEDAVRAAKKRRERLEGRARQ